MKMTRRNFLSASALTLLSCQLAPAARADCLLSGLFHGIGTALPPKPLTAKVVDANPFMGRSESNIHHDCPYSVAQPLERGFKNYYSIIQGVLFLWTIWTARFSPSSQRTPVCR